MLRRVIARLGEQWPRALVISSIRGRMAIFLALALLPAGAIAIQTGLNTAASRRAAIEEHTSAQAAAVTAQAQRVFNEMADVLRVLATSGDLRSRPLGASCQDRLEALTREYQGIGSIAVLSTSGAVRCSVPPADSEPARSHVFRGAVERGAMVFGYLERGRLTGLPSIAAASPLRDPNDSVIGYVGLTAPFERVRDALRGSELGPDSIAYFVDAHGERLAPPLHAPNARVLTPIPPALVRAHVGEGLIQFRHEGRVALVAPLFAPDIYLVAAWRTPARSLSDWLNFVFAVASPLLMWAIAIAVGWVAIEVFVATPLSQVEMLARDYARGADIPPGSAFRSAPDEIRSLVRTLSAMAKTLRSREQKLTEALNEERALLKEVHHRVKNNLQVVASLLNIQARAAQDPAEAWGLARAHDRVQLLSIVHQRIYSSGEVRDVRLDEIARDVARQMLNSRGETMSGVELELSVGEARCDVDHAVPMGFLIGESLSSALDCIPPGAPAKLSLRLHQEPGGAIRFSINAPYSEDGERPQDGRLRLVDAFARQLGADVGRQCDDRFRIWAQTPPLISEAA